MALPPVCPRPRSTACVLHLSNLPLACAGAAVGQCHGTRDQEEVKGLDDQILDLTMPTMRTLQRTLVNGMLDSSEAMPKR